MPRVEFLMALGRYKVFPFEVELRDLEAANGSIGSVREVLEAGGKLSLEEQETLLEALQRRLIERRREELACDIRQAQEDFIEAVPWVCYKCGEPKGGSSPGILESRN